MRVMDVMLAIPGFLMAIGIVALFGGGGLLPVMIAIGVVNIPIFTRLMRGSILAQRDNDYVLAARAVGVPSRKVLASHILPNAISPVIVAATLALATAIIDAAGLGFLGLGPQDPATPEWGTMLVGTIRYLQTAPFLAIFPGIAIVIAVMGFNLIGDGLREALDPKLRGRIVSADAAPRGRGPPRPLQDAARARPRGQRHLVRRPAGRDARPRRRVGLREERHRAGDDGHPPARGPDPVGEHQARRARARSGSPSARGGGSGARRSR